MIHEADFVLVTALPEEREAVLGQLPGYVRPPPAQDDIRTYYQADLPVTFPDGSTGTYRVIVMCLLGMGRVQAVVATSDAIRRWHPRYVILVGIAGGIAARNIRLGDILISDQIVDYELQKLTAEGPEIRWDVQRADPRLSDACSSYTDEGWRRVIGVRRPERGKSKRHTGPIASGDKVVAVGEILMKYRGVWPKLIGVEMEAAGAATAAFQSTEKPGFFMVRSVSDLADENKDSAEVGKWRPYACAAASAFAVAFLRSGPVPLSDVPPRNGAGSLSGQTETRSDNRLGTKRVELRIEGEFGEFTINRQQDIVGVLAALLKVDPGTIQILSVAPGSIIVVLQMPEIAANRLSEMASSHDFRLKSLGIESVLVEGRGRRITVKSSEETQRSSLKLSGSSLPGYKRKALEARLNDLTAEYQAASQQLGYTLNAVAVVKLQRQLDGIAQEIERIQNELGLRSDTQTSSSPDHEVEPQSDPVKGDNQTPTLSSTVYGAGNRWAVLVGANSYEDARHFGSLQVCVKDVEATREQLIAGGFDPARIRLLTDNTDEKPTRANILAALKSVADATEPDDLLLFYYSGHGDEAGGESYLVARDGRHLVLGDTAVSTTRVKQIMDTAPARAKVILLDACHSGANIGQKGPKPMTPEFIQRVFEQAEGLAILASCKQGQFSYEWRLQDRSVFTHYLLEALRGEADRDEKGFVTVQDASRHVTDGVKLWASQNNLSQTPTLQYTVAGDIILVHRVTEPEQSNLFPQNTSADDHGTLKGWLEKLGFVKGNPFGSCEADKEVDRLPELLIWRPYFDRVVGEPDKPKNVLLSADRGAGKSATREYVRNQCLSGDIHDRALPVCYTDFTGLLDAAEGAPAKVSRRAHVEAILRAGMGALVLAHQDKPALFNALSPRARSELLSMAAEFAPADCETLRILIGGPEARTRWEKVTDIELIDHFVNLVKQLSPSSQRHYESVYVLVDPVVNAEIEAASALFRLLAGDAALLSRPGVAFKFFLPAAIAVPLRKAVDPYHLFPFVEITWDEAALKKMIECRLSHFSDGAIEHLEQLCTTAAVQHLPRVWSGCGSSPRVLLQLCEEIRRRHVERTRTPLFEPADIIDSLL